MRLYILTAFFFISLKATSQCSNCTSLKEALKNPAQVKSLIINGQMSGHVWDSVPASIGLLINIEILYLTDHNISKLPDEIGKLKKLKELSFGGCKLSEIPESVFTLKNLKELILYNNSFSEKYLAELKARVKKEMPGTTLFAGND
jgi:Leucine-rich repeat (LRR) protein